MKKHAMKMMITVFLVAVFAAVSFAGQGGQAGTSKGAGDGSGPTHDILAGTEFTIEGTIVSYTLGEGVEVSGVTVVSGEVYDENGDGNIVIFGMAPSWYWDALGVDKPAVGEQVTISGYVVDFDGTLRNIAVSVTVSGDEEVQLRDPDTGYPLWRGPHRTINTGK